MVELLIGSQLFDSFVQKRAEEYSALSSPPTIEEFAKLHTHDPFDQVFGIFIFFYFFYYFLFIFYLLFYFILFFIFYFFILNFYLLFFVFHQNNILSKTQLQTISLSPLSPPKKIDGPLQPPLSKHSKRNSITHNRSLNRRSSRIKSCCRRNLW